MASGALISVSLVGSIAYGVDISNNTEVTDNFQQNNGNWSVKADSKIKAEGVTFKKLETLEAPINHFTIQTDKKATIDTDAVIGAYVDKNKNARASSFNITTKEGIENNGSIVVLKDSKIQGKTTLQTNSNLDILGSKLEIIGDVSAENNSSIEVDSIEDTNIVKNALNNLDNKSFNAVFSKLFVEDNGKYKDKSLTKDNKSIGFAELVKDIISKGASNATLNIQGNLKTKGNTTFKFFDNGSIKVTTGAKDTGKATLSSQSSFNLSTSNIPLSSDKTLIFAEKGVDIVDSSDSNKSVLTQQNDKTWKASKGASLEVTYEKEVATYLSNPSLLNGILVPTVENLKNENYNYELRTDEKKNNLFIKVNIDTTKLNTANLKDAKSIGDFLQTQVKSANTRAKTELESAKKNLQSAKEAYNNITGTNKNQILQNIDLALKDIEAKINATDNVSKKTNATTQELLGVLLEGADSKVGENILVTLTNQKDQRLLASTLGDTLVLKNTTTSISRSGNTQEGLAILNSLASANINTDTLLNVITDRNFFKDTKEQGATIASSNASSSQLGTINIANDMAIGGRIARFNNPYIEAKKFAALHSDAAYSYYDEYVSSIWANAFGGANIIGGNAGGIYGLSAGIDRNIYPNFLLGGYFTYATSTLKGLTNKQQSKNYQLGLYSLIKFAQDWEIGLKSYAQLSPTNQYNTNILGLDSASFTRRFFGFNGSLGKVLQISNDFFLKPFGGINYYFSHTPNYTENGTVLAKHIRSSTSNSASLEAGLELRNYFAANSYLYFTPKLEQYIINNGDDYVARFAGSSSTFRISNNQKAKTYGQVTLGGTININDDLSWSVGGGFKQIIAGKSNSTNETYVTGNIGLKYKF